MPLFKNPSWINTELLKYERLEDIPASVFNEVNTNLDKVLNQTNPIATVIITAWNEEANIVRCLYSLSKNQTNYPFDIIVVNNNSKDRTQDTLDRIHIKSLFQGKQGCGPARKLGQENALGKYILFADADCIYPKVWVQKMMEKLTEKKVACVYGRYSFLAPEGKSRFKFVFFEFAKDVFAEIRHINRPHLNAFGISMGFVKEYGLKVGIDDRNVRGDDGRLCFDLIPYGKVKQVRSRSARAWTGARTLDQDGSFSRALVRRIVNEIYRIPSYFSRQAPHDTKTSENNETEVLRVLEKKLKRGS
jgi:glycosyltransferase involved in cell wall biosynthesis